MTELTVAQENIVPVMKANDLQVMEAVVSYYLCLVLCLSICLLSICLSAIPAATSTPTSTTNNTSITTNTKVLRSTRNANTHPDPDVDFNARFVLLLLFCC